MLNLSEGDTLNFSEIVYAGQLDSQGGVSPIEDHTITECGGTCWLHLDVEHQGSAEWLSRSPLIPNPVREALANNSTRPRVTRLGKDALVVLRSINFANESHTDELIVLRIHITGWLIVTTRRQPIQAVEEILDDLQKKQGLERIAATGWWR